MRYFYVINIKDERLKIIIDGIRLIANPGIKYSAHITVKGPLERQQNRIRINKETKQRKVIITGAGNFFSFNQNTVFLRCSSPLFNIYWQKPEYKDINPHLTLYDGGNDFLAQNLYSILESYNLKEIYFEATVIEELITIKRGNKFNYDFNWLSRILGEKIDISFLKKISSENRLLFINKLLRRIASKMNLKYIHEKNAEYLNSLPYFSRKQK